MKYYRFGLMTLAGLLLLSGISGAANPELRARFRTVADMLRDPTMQFAHDTQSSDDAGAYRMVIGLNMAALGERCDKGQIPMATCDDLLSEIGGYLADKQVSLAEIKPWLTRLKALGI